LVIVAARPALLVTASPCGVLLLLVGPLIAAALLTTLLARPLLLLTGISTAALLSTLLLLSRLALLHRYPSFGLLTREPAS
jgi:hypothetical protein